MDIADRKCEYISWQVCNEICPKKKKPMASPSSCHMEQQEPVKILIKFDIREIH
jgi:hypothetical protein